MAGKFSELQIVKLGNYLTARAINGTPPLTSASNLALEYKIDAGYESDDERVDSLIKWETSKNFTSGFITGLGGILTLPVAIPSALGASWLIQARMVAAIAQIYGHDLQEDRVKTLILLCLLGDAAKDVVKAAGIKITHKFTEKALAGVSEKILLEINRQVGFRLLSKAGEKGIINLAKGVPLMGGVVAGTFDAISCRVVGKIAKKAFKR